MPVRSQSACSLSAGFHRAIVFPAVAVLAVIAPASAANPGQGAAPSVPVASVFTLTEVARTDQPWAMVFVAPDQALITQKSGELRLLRTNGMLSAPLPGVPAVRYQGGQGGLLDVALHPDFKSNRYVYLSYAEPGPGGTAGLALGRGRYVNGAIKDFKVLWRDPVKLGGDGHFSGRIAFGLDKSLYLTVGDRQVETPAQDLKSAQGKILHMGPSGGVVIGNPFRNGDPVTSRVWSLGHRNLLGIAFDINGQLWAHENGPQGGDELNRIAGGTNQGWPIVSNGSQYGGGDIPDHDTRPDFDAPEIWWTPSIAPSGLMVYSGAAFPAFAGNGFLGALAGQALVRVTFSGEGASETVRYATGFRVREVEQAPDGSLWLLEDGGNARIFRLTPLPG